MIVRSYHTKKPEANKEVKKWTDLGFEAVAVPGDKSLGKKMKWFVLTVNQTKKPKKSTEPERPETIAEKMDRVARELVG